MDAMRMPVLFIGHGSPMNAIADNTWSRAFARLAAELPTPKAILAVSAHWFVDGVQTTGDHRPETIHDFGGFPQALFDMRYPAPGSPELARQVVDLLGAERASVSLDWGLDHGTWSVLHWLRPQADLPVVQLSLDRRLAPGEHVALGRALAPLRDEGVLILASGNVTHNLRDAMARARQPEPETPPWAASFDADVAAALVQRDADWLAAALETEAGRHSHPSPDHYLPVLYAAAAADGVDAVTFPVAGFDLGSLSMRAALYAP
ncbi:MAG: 4,5-DOPA dioxygenase extradiol [Armatimonadetes bacterium]|nr:4,5-DOPA dioxygenase extradiol [Armatimonadota bacterium]